MLALGLMLGLGLAMGLVGGLVLVLVLRLLLAQRLGRMIFTGAGRAKNLWYCSMVIGDSCSLGPRARLAARAGACPARLLGDARSLATRTTAQRVPSALLDTAPVQRVKSKLPPCCRYSWRASFRHCSERASARTMRARPVTR